MKTSSMTLRITIFFSIVLCLILFQNLYAQKGDLVLTFSGKDAVTSNIVPLESVKVTNETQGGDTTLYGAAPTLLLQWASGIFEQNHGQKASFILEPNYPNPFAESTTVNIQLRKPQRLIVTIYDQQGAVAAMLEQDFGFGTHRFEITVPQNRLCLLTVNDGVTTKTLKMFSTSGKDYRIKYLGTGENAGYKSETETTTFVFQPGDVLKYTVNAAGYYEYITYDNPAANMNYVFSLQPNTSELPPTVTTAAVTNITSTAAACGGDVTNEGSAAVTARGVCWNTSPGATIANSFTADGAGTGAFTSAITGLTESTTYFARAYATNQFGTAYGNEVSFTTAIQELLYRCDSAVTYSNQFGIEKTIYTRDATGKLLKVVYKYLNTTYGVWVNDRQGLFTYDMQGNRLSSVYQDWNTEIGSWVNSSHGLYTYDAQGNQLSYLSQYWNTEIGSWVNNWQYLINYDASGNMLLFKEQSWDTNIGSWVNSWQDLMNYDASGNMLSEMSQYWNTEIGSWVNEGQTNFTYDASGNILSMLNQFWDTNIGSWVGTWQNFYTFDNYGNMLSEISQQWFFNIGSWVNSQKYNYIYNQSGNMLSQINQLWDTNIGSWVNTYQYLYTYDAQGNYISSLGQDWNTEIGSWVNDWQYLYTYDSQGNQISSLSQWWNTDIGSWVHSSQYLYTYDTQGNQLSSIYQDWYVNYGTWVNVNKLEYQYDYPTRKITAMYYEWSGAWVPVDNYGEDITIYNYSLGYFYDFYKIELWYNSYQLLSTKRFLELPDESFYLIHPNQENNDITTGNPTRKDAFTRTASKTNIHENEVWRNNDKKKAPSQNLPQRNMPVGKSTRDFNHSK
jgi:hypothetical protein